MTAQKLTSTPPVVDESPRARPSTPGEWTLAQIQGTLSRELPQSLLSSRSQGGKAIYYLSWPTIAGILDKYAPGWCWEIEATSFTSDRIFVVGRLSIQTADGVVTRSATGTEELKRSKFNKQTQRTELVELAYGDPSSNAESMALRRAAAKFGLGRYLWEN